MEIYEQKLLVVSVEDLITQKKARMKTNNKDVTNLAFSFLHHFQMLPNDRFFSNRQEKEEGKTVPKGINSKGSQLQSNVIELQCN